MPTDLSAIHFDPKDFPAEPMACLRCGTEAPMLTELPSEPAGQVPIGGLAACAVSVRPSGSNAVPARPAPACNRVRRETD